MNCLTVKLLEKQLRIQQTSNLTKFILLGIHVLYAFLGFLHLMFSNATRTVKLYKSIAALIQVIQLYMRLGMVLVSACLTIHSFSNGMSYS